MPTPVTPWPAAKVARLRQWRREHLSEDPNSGDGAGQGAGDLRAQRNASQANIAALIKAHKGREEVRKLQRENDLAEGKLISREEVERQNVAKVLAVKTGMLGLIEEMRDSLSDDQVEELTEKIHALLNSFAGTGTGGHP